ncbi:MAG: methionyl-tRNA formyltransferase [Acidimicrobiales bacterium]
MTIPPPAEIRRIAYLGTPELAVPPLRALVEAGYEVPLVVSRADTRRGRGGAHQPSPVKMAASTLGLRVTDDLADLADVDVDLGVVVAYGRIIPADVLDRLAMINIHFSLLPRWRGAAPVERAILAGDQTTGVCLMAVEEGLDTGAVYRRDEVDIDPDETLEELRGRLVEIGVAQLLDALGHGLGEPEPQRGDAVLAAKITPEERRIDWTEPAVAIHRRIRVGGAWTTFRGKRLKVHRAAVVDATGAPGTIVGTRVFAADGALDLIEVQTEGKGRQGAAAWRNGAQPTADDRLL